MKVQQGAGVDEEKVNKIPRIVIYGSDGFEELIRRFKTYTGKSFPVLFSDPHGAGRTVASDIIAAELSLKLYRADLSAVVSKYIGETEKNLARIFDAAAALNAILFFEEADALFGERAKANDLDARYANMELKLLLRKIEEYNGIVILATRHSTSIDEAFIRKMQFVVDFPYALNKIGHKKKNKPA
ncbi:MAG: ATP-binding protein [Nitrospirae bacterium]|nr:ATP-binding protein [Nitrospirota bacterium]